MQLFFIQCSQSDRTVHRFAGIGTGEGNKLELVQRAMAGRSKGWWQRAKGLVKGEGSEGEGVKG